MAISFSRYTIKPIKSVLQNFIFGKYLVHLFVEHLIGTI